MRISEITRRDIIDAMHIEGVVWHGRLDETEFLNRLYELSKLPSFDGRFKNADGDIWQHRVNNNDWPDDWIFGDSRFMVSEGEDEIFLRFLCETLHPVVRPDVAEAEKLCQMYNDILKNDGFRIVEKTRISGKPVYAGRYVGFSVTPGVTHARKTLISVDEGYVAQQIARMEAAVNDPALAIGTAKELVETCCRTILEKRGISAAKNADLPQLVKLTVQHLQRELSVSMRDAASA